MKVIIYSRVSTTVQSCQRQTNELLLLAKTNKWQVIKIYEEKVSGMDMIINQPKLVEMFDFINKNHVDKILCWELSRICRVPSELSNILKFLNKKKISLFIKVFNIETLDENRNINKTTETLLNSIMEYGSFEAKIVRSRVKSGYDAFRENGGKVGRKEGFKKDMELVLKENQDVIDQLNLGLSIRRIMKLTNRSSGTVQKIKKYLDNKSVSGGNPEGF